MSTETYVETHGRRLHAYDSGGDEGALAVFWHHGTPNIGALPEPLLPAAARRGIRWVSYDRPGYGGSAASPGRDVASAAADVATIADALGIDRFAVMGHSGGGPHALACAALLPERVLGVVCVSVLAPFESGPATAPPARLRHDTGAHPLLSERDAQGLDWFAGMAAAGMAELRAAARGRSALQDILTSTEFDPEQFTPEDHAALSGEWAWLGEVAAQGTKNGLGGFLDDDLAYVSPWGFDPGQVTAPTLFLHGGRDRIAPRSHAEWLTSHLTTAELWLRPDEGHISVLKDGVSTLDWLLDLR